MNRSRAILLPLLLFLVLVMFLSSAVARAEQVVITSKVDLATAPGPIRAELFQPANGKTRAAILVLHGAGGTLFDGPEMRRVARYLAADGNAAYVLHYFNRTGTIAARDTIMQKHFESWRETVHDSVMAIQKLRRNEEPVGIYGYSLGGFLALFTASDNARVGAVVEHAGGVWNGQEQRIGRMPPVLMVHGEADSRVAFAKYALPLRQLLRRRSAKVETLFLPGEEHRLSPSAMSRTRAAAAAFFRLHLGTR